MVSTSAVLRESFFFQLNSKPFVGYCHECDVAYFSFRHCIDIVPIWPKPCNLTFKLCDPFRPFKIVPPF